MSRSYLAAYDEDWQRKKAWLIRGLFHDIPVLSPVREESDPESSPGRPDSPLPPLIIEREPRKRKHDDSDEYYEKLLKKTKKIYKQLFIDNLDVDEVDFDVKTTSGEISDDNFDDDRTFRAHSHGVEDNYDDSPPFMGHFQDGTDNFKENARRDSFRENSEDNNVTEDSNKSKDDEVSKETAGDEEDEPESNGNETPLYSDVTAEVETETSDEGPSHIQLTTEAQVHVDGGLPSDRESKEIEHSETGRLTEVYTYRGVAEELIEVLEDNGDPDHIELTTEPQAHNNESPPSDEDSRDHQYSRPEEAQVRLEEDKTSESVRSVLLPRLTEAHTYLEQSDEELTDEEVTEEVNEEQLTEDLDDTGDPETESAITSTSSEENNNEIPEIMRTPQPKISVESLPLPRRITDISETNSILSLEYRSITSSAHNEMEQHSSEGRVTRVIQETVSPPNGNKESLPEGGTTKNMDEILSSIINVSQKTEGSPLGKRKLIDKTVEITEKRKKSCKDMSVQTTDKKNSCKDESVQTDDGKKSCKDESVQTVEKLKSFKAVSIQTIVRGIKCYADISIQIPEMRSCKDMSVQTDKVMKSCKDVSIQADKITENCKDMSIQTDSITKSSKDLSVQADIRKEHFVEASVQCSDFFEELRRDLFVGIPLKIFKICSCAGHI